MIGPNLFKLVSSLYIVRSANFPAIRAVEKCTCTRRNRYKRDVKLSPNGLWSGDGNENITSWVSVFENHTTIL